MTFLPPRPAETAGPLPPTAVGACGDAARVHESAAGAPFSSPVGEACPAPTENTVSAHLRNIALARSLGELLAQGKTQRKAAASLGISAAKASRLLAAWREGGEAALMPKYGNCGRPSYASLATETDRLAIQRLALKCDSESFAYQIWADNPECSEALRAVILRERKSRHNLAPSLRQLAHVTPEVKALHRGEKAFQAAGFTVMRDGYERLPDGSMREVQPGDWWEMDDMSVNQPFWWEYTGGDSDLSQRQGAAIGRQSLFALDVASGKWLGFELVGRPRDAYRASDILRFLRRLFEDHGLPRRGLRLERGTWASRTIAGDAGPAKRKIPEMADAEKQLLVGGLGQLGLLIEWCNQSNHKGAIEGGFDHLQTALSLA